MPTDRVTFMGAAGHELSARLELPEGGEPTACALFAHCFTCTKNIKAAVTLSRSLAAEGVAVLRFDFTGLGESEGDFADTNFSSNVADLIHAARYMEQELEAPSLLVGHSLGGAAVLHAAHSLPSVRAVATIGSPADPAHVLQHVECSREEIEETGQAEVLLAGRPFTIKSQFLEDLEETRMVGVVEGLGRALLILHSPIDETVSVENAARLYATARHPKSFVSLDDSDHLLSKERDSAYAGRVLAAWSSRYVQGGS
jgi:putative redox protein